MIVIFLKKYFTVNHFNTDTPKEESMAKKKWKVAGTLTVKIRFLRIKMTVAKISHSKD